MTPEWKPIVSGVDFKPPKPIPFPTRKRVERKQQLPTTLQNLTDADKRRVAQLLHTLASSETQKRELELLLDSLKQEKQELTVKLTCLEKELNQLQLRETKQQEALEQKESLLVQESLVVKSQLETVQNTLEKKTFQLEEMIRQLTPRPVLVEQSIQCDSFIEPKVSEHSVQCDIPKEEPVEPVSILSPKRKPSPLRSPPKISFKAPSPVPSPVPSPTSSTRAIETIFERVLMRHLDQLPPKSISNTPLSRSIQSTPIPSTQRTCSPRSLSSIHIAAYQQDGTYLFPREDSMMVNLKELIVSMEESSLDTL